MNRYFGVIVSGVVFLNTIECQQIQIWKRDERYDNWVIASNSNIMIKQLSTTSPSSCGRFCKKMGSPLAFSHRESECYCYKSKQMEGQTFTLMNGAQYYSKVSLSDESNCEDHQYQYFPEIRVCYKLYKDTLNWQDANAKCIMDGSHLIILDSVEKFQMIRTILRYDTFYWIGLEDLDKDDVWQWTSDKILDVNSTLWYPREPNFTHELCGCFKQKSTHQLGIFNCNCISDFGYICEL